MKITSPVFQHEEGIPPRFTADGSNVSPPLQWSAVPDDSKSLALICDDPDAPMGTWVHWVAFNIPTHLKGLEAGIAPLDTLPDGMRQGRNDFGRIGYGGPAPPSGIHRYFFKIYALDIQLDCESGITKEKLLSEMQGHILAEAQLVGTYRR